MATTQEAQLENEYDSNSQDQAPGEGEDQATDTTDQPGVSGDETTTGAPTEGATAGEDPAAQEQANAAQEERDRLAATQNLTAENAVPEQRPTAMTTPDPRAQHSRLYRELKERGAITDDEPMDQEAYDRADSDEQREAAAEDERKPRLLNGTRVRITEGPHEGRNAVILETTYTNHEEASKAASGVPAVAMYAEVESYLVRTRDSRVEEISVSPDEVERFDLADGWARGG